MDFGSSPIIAVTPNRCSPWLGFLKPSHMQHILYCLISFSVLKSKSDSALIPYLLTSAPEISAWWWNVSLAHSARPHSPASCPSTSSLMDSCCLQVEPFVIRKQIWPGASMCSVWWPASGFLSFSQYPSPPSFLSSSFLCWASWPLQRLLFEIWTKRNLKSHSVCCRWASITWNPHVCSSLGGWWSPLQVGSCQTKDDFMIKRVL